MNIWNQLTGHPCCEPSSTRIITEEGKFVPEDDTMPTLPRVNITEAMLGEAIALWADAVSRRYRGLILATSSPRGDEVTSWPRGESGNTGEYDDYPDSDWVYENDVYTNTETDETLDGNDFFMLRDTLCEHMRDVVGDTGESLVKDALTLGSFASVMVGSLTVGSLAMYAFGRGGIRMVRPSDVAAIVELVQRNVTYLTGFVSDIVSGDLSPAQIVARAKMYGDSVGQAVGVARAKAKGLALPAYPLDGSTRCRTNCKCHWRIVETDERWEAYWVLGPVKTEHCIDCERRSRNWNPYIIPKGNLA